MAHPVPPSMEHLGERPFSFYPAVIGIDHNEWTFRSATWSEMLVRNRTTGQEVWIPRRFVGEVSRIDEPVVIVGLNRELEYRGGMMVPHERRVIEIPSVGNTASAPAPGVREPQQAPSMNARLNGGAESRVGRLLAIIIAGGVLLCLAAIVAISTSNRRVSYQAVVQNDLGFTENDDYFSVVNKLGTPAEDKWRSNQGELQYRRLGYPQQGLSIILMGSDRRDIHYLGAMDKDWRVVHSINSNAEAMLRNLKRF